MSSEYIYKQYTENIQRDTTWALNVDALINRLHMFKNTKCVMSIYFYTVQRH